MCERDEAERRDTATSLGGKSDQSAKVVVWLWKKDRVDRGSHVQRGEKISASTLSLSEWLEGEPGWCDLLHHGMQPLYPAEA